MSKRVNFWVSQSSQNEDLGVLNIAGRINLKPTKGYKYLFCYISSEYQNHEKTKNFEYNDLFIYDFDGKGAASPAAKVKKKFVKAFLDATNKSLEKSK